VAKVNKRQLASYSKRLKRVPYLFLAPYLLMTAIFFIYPLINTFILTFYQTNGPKSEIFVGLSNFKYVLTDSDFHTALKNTTIFAVFSICIQLPLSLGLALLLNSSKDKLKGFFRLMIFSPNLIGQIFVGIMFAVLFVPHFGLFNRFVFSLIGWGLEEGWLENPRLVMPAIIITNIWMYVGFNMIYFLAGLQGVDKSLVEAARIDGANPFQVFCNITLPAIKPVATFVVVMSTIGSYQLFELPFALLKSSFGPGNSGMTIVGYLYSQAFNTGDLGVGAAVGWVLALIIFIISMAQIKISGTLKEGM